MSSASLIELTDIGPDLSNSTMPSRPGSARAAKMLESRCLLREEVEVVMTSDYSILVFLSRNMKKSKNYLFGFE
jgi:hypothetical protein